MMRTSAIIFVLLVLLAATPGPTCAQSPGETDCKAVTELLEEQNRQLSAEFRQVRREIAALRSRLEQPGTKDIFAGVGYILGLFGAAALVAARRKG
jgi:nickel transport protein